MSEKRPGWWSPSKRKRYDRKKVLERQQKLRDDAIKQQELELEDDEMVKDLIEKGDLPNPERSDQQEHDLKRIEARDSDLGL